MTTTIQEAIKTGFEEVFEFTDGYYTYKRCKKSVTALNKMFEASFKYVYTTPLQPTASKGGEK